MTTRHRFQVPALLITALVACSQPATGNAAGARADASAIQRAITQARPEVWRKVEEENIQLSPGDQSLPPAEIAPSGDLLIDGQKVATDAAQRRLLLQHRNHIAAIASAAADIGIQGAELATRAMGEAFRGVFDGDAAEVEQRIEAEAGKIEAQAALLCERMPALLQSQRDLAEALPEFRPYATMDAGDIDCRDPVQTAGVRDPGTQ